MPNKLEEELRTIQQYRNIAKQLIKKESLQKDLYKKYLILRTIREKYAKIFTEKVLVELKQWDRAIDIFKKVLQTSPNDSNCFFNIGICFLNKEEYNYAIDNFKKTLKKLTPLLLKGSTSRSS